jgi:hypothetical protein
MDAYLDDRLFWAIYVQRQTDGDRDLVAIMPASGRTTECPAYDYRRETVAYHLAHELTASLEYDGSDAVMISGPDADFPDVLEPENPDCQSRYRLIAVSAWWYADRYVN